MSPVANRSMGLDQRASTLPRPRKVSWGVALSLLRSPPFLSSILRNYLPRGHEKGANSRKAVALVLLPPRECVCELYVGKAGRTWYQGEHGKGRTWYRENMHGAWKNMVQVRTCYQGEYSTKQNMIPEKTWYQGEHGTGRTW